jgi:2-oxoisovalerate ferredoxin oxidoreductase gamma subunit
MGPPMPEPCKSSDAAPLAARSLSEIRLVGRGGQGVVTAGELLGRAALLEGRHAQSIPTFGPERRGALSSCTLRLSDEEILLKCSSISPHVLLLLDPTIWHHAPALAGLQEGGTLIFNSPLAPAEIDAELRTRKYGCGPPAGRYALYTVDATGIALEILKAPITNTAMMGALAGATGLLSMDSIEKVLTGRFGARAAGNIRSARQAHDGLRSL